METKTRWERVALATGGMGALLVTFACGTQGAAGVAPQAAAAVSQTGVPVVVSCEPTQRTIVRPTIVNGAAMSQVECIPADPAASPAAYAQPQVVAQPQARPVAIPVSYQAPQRAYRDIDDTQVVPVAARQTAAPVRTRQVVYEEPVRPTRSVKKSAVIIGSSAGVGAGVGAAVGGKKGALIGAAIGGGGAALWDQITRRK